MTTNNGSSIPIERLQQGIFLIRGGSVMLDFHLAILYGVMTKNLNKAVARNRRRFPDDFVFQLSEEEWKSLRFQFGTSKVIRRGGRRYLPYAFTEQGVAMLSSVLRSERAALMNVAIMRAFVKLREMLSTHKDLARKLKELERRIEQHDAEIQAIICARGAPARKTADKSAFGGGVIRQLMEPPEKPKRQIGFRTSEPKVKYRARPHIT